MTFRVNFRFSCRAFCRALPVLAVAWTLSLPAAPVHAQPARAPAAAGAAASTGEPGGPARLQPRIRVVASFTLLADLVRRVGVDRVVVQSLVPYDADVHVFSPGPGAVRTLAEAQLFVVNGLGYEGWMTRLVRSSRYRGPVLVASEGIEPLMVDARAHDHDHDHGHGKKDASRAVRKIGSASQLPDPHAWQSITNVRRYIANITEGLCALEPASCNAFRENARLYGLRLDQVDQEIRRWIDPIPREQRRVLTSHAAFAYFGREYGITFVSPIGISTEAEPSAGTIARLIREIREHDIKAFFVENIRDGRLVDRISAETGGARSGRLYSDSLTESGGAAVDYTSLMQTNARAIARALAPERGPVTITPPAARPVETR